ncbi:MAG: hypothetical protein JWP00_975 [Chloroflexi bacterium]|jgi:hypothetical protein|nr:hypothetical protein [Chloroflexota bacterium]
MPVFKPSKFRTRLTQPAIEDNDSSLLARAFRTRLLGGSEADPALFYPAGPGAKKVPVAVYQDRTASTRTLLRKISLTIGAPLLAIIIVGLIVFSTFAPDKVSLPVQSESVIFGDVPVPANVRPIQRAKLNAQQQFVDVYLNQVLPHYSEDFKGAASYISSKSLDELKSWYSTRLLDTKSLRWQVYGKPTTYNTTYTSLYLRALTSQVPGSVEALVVQLEPVSSLVLKKDPTSYDEQAKLGETVIILSRAWLAPR